MLTITELGGQRPEATEKTVRRSKYGMSAVEDHIDHLITMRYPENQTSAYTEHSEPNRLGL